MNIVLLGNCQVAGVARCLTVMNPALAVRAFVFPGPQAERDLVDEALRGCDVAFVQTARALEAFRSAALQAPRVVVFPRIYFAALHPDIVYLTSGGALVETPLGHYNSKLTVAGYLRGLSIEQTLELFEAATFRRLGYLDAWEASSELLRGEIAASDVALEQVPERWAKAGTFMYSVNHPRLRVLADVAAAMLRTIGVDMRTSRADTYVHDELKSAVVWPVYPDVARAYGLEGDYCFKTQGAGPAAAMLSLGEFVSQSYEVYGRLPAESLAANAFDLPGFCRELFDPAQTAPARAVAPRRPSAFPRFEPYQVWKSAVASRAWPDVDPVRSASVTVLPADRIASIGSCFAQHISRSLRDAGLNYYVTEAAPPGLAPAEAGRRHFGVFSARYGNVYTARQLRQLHDRAFGAFQPDAQAWRRPDGRFVDPFRPTVEPDGYATEHDVAMARSEHLAATRTLFQDLDVLIVTLGLTEAWRAVSDGAVFPVAPAAVADGVVPAEYAFVNFDADEVAGDLEAFLERLRSVNPKARVIVTVSPVPLVATYEDRHVLESTTYSKAVLRVAAERLSRRHPGVCYFPSYELVASPASKGMYFEPNLRSVTRGGVDHVMRLFLQHVCRIEPVDHIARAPLVSGQDVICEEEIVVDEGV